MASKLQKQQHQGRWAATGIAFAPAYLQQVRRHNAGQACLVCSAWNAPRPMIVRREASAHPDSEKRKDHVCTIWYVLSGSGISVGGVCRLFKCTVGLAEGALQVQARH